MAEAPTITLSTIVSYWKKSDLPLRIGETIFDLLPAVPGLPGEGQLSLFHAPETETQLELFADLALRTDHPIIRFSDQVSSSFRARIIEAWEQLHTSLQHGLVRRGVSAYAPLSVLEYRTQHSDKLMRSSGFYDSAARVVVAPQSHVWASSLLVPQWGAVAVLYHEIGHAVDFTLNMLSEKQGFISAYQKDKAEFPSDDERRFWYYLWTDNCEQEAFAETWCQQALKAFSCKENSYDPEFEVYFPKTWAWVAANVPSAKNGFSLPYKTINQPDGAELTPIEILETEIDDDEFTQILRAGVNPLRLRPRDATSLIERCINRNQPGRVREIIIMLATHPLLKSGLMADYHISAIRRDVQKWRAFMEKADIKDAAALTALAGLENI